MKKKDISVNPALPAVIDTSSRDGQATEKITVLGDRARVHLQNRKRELLSKMSRLTSLQGIDKKRSKQPFVVRLYNTLLRTEFDSARVHNIRSFNIGPLYELAKILFGGTRIRPLSEAKRLIKNYTQIGLAISLRDTELLKSVSDGLESVVKKFTAIHGTSPIRRSGNKGVRKRKFRRHALELTSFKKTVICDPQRENDTKGSSISKWLQVVTSPGPDVGLKEKEHFRRKVRQLLRTGGFRHTMYDCLGSIPSRSGTCTFPAGDFPTGGLLTEIQTHAASAHLPPVIVTERGIQTPGLITSLFRDHLLDPRAKEARVVSVSDTFKDRVLTIHPGHQHLLTDLQQSLLQFLSKFEAFYVGKEDTDCHIMDVRTVTEGLFCSGDYSQATDTFSSDLSEIVLEEIVECIDFHIECSHEELEMLRNYIIQSCTRWQLTHDGNTYQQRRGQLMGTVLSFPVLNIYNFAAFACLAEEYHRREMDLGALLAMVRINGDDILFNEVLGFIKYWTAGVSRYGMSLNVSKSSISDKYCSLNSQYYYYCKREGTLHRFRREQVYLLNTEAGFDRNSGGFTIRSVVEKARSLFNLGAWKSLNLWFRLRAIEHVEFRRFYGPVTEEVAERQRINIEKNLMLNAHYLAGQSLILVPQEESDDKSDVEDHQVIDTVEKAPAGRPSLWKYENGIILSSVAGNPETEGISHARNLTSDFLGEVGLLRVRALDLLERVLSS